jgi:CubicO group peptidase (beta-lactamase class C family)
MAVMLLAQHKELRFDEPLNSFFTEFPAYGHEITVEHLLQHTSGVLDYEGLIPKGTTLPVLDQDVLRILIRGRRTLFRPGSRFRYSNSGYALLAMIVESRSGLRFARFLKDNIFDPLGMTETVAYEAGVSRIPNRAFGYAPRGHSFRFADQSLTSSVLGDGGVYSSVADLRKWDAALRTDLLVSRRILARAFKPGVPADRPRTGYGFGWYVSAFRGFKEVWHNGETTGFTTRIVRYPQPGLTIIILTNRSGAEISEIPRMIAKRCLIQLGDKST